MSNGVLTLNILSIVNELLDFSKLKAGGFVPLFQEVDVALVVNEAIKFVQPQANMRKVEIVRTVLNNKSIVNADKRLLQQVLINILANSIKYSNDGEQVLLTAGPTKTGRVMIEITDFGRGMSPDEIERALTPFSSDHTLSDFPSTGLGLSLSRELTELMNGRFTINSTVGEKTRVRLVFEKE
jgi:signal transduction histidine kinase